ncbi:hypothetical protein [Pedobacter chitinilyticus]|uniref:Uncharacterized protein n=1 Tax=Pedobacter chitinilyticus TaxID=2233776 RepID=A0A443YRC6_9SPHI|nr:hypothetical protein [Pedobacter chitinilyticus]RWU06296.1 hypothetical protein DPV69_13470 [Pedobacter chitinilyticus]
MKKHLLKISVLLLLVAAVWSCRKEHAVPAANVLASYKGSDKNVLKIIEELKKPENNTLLANLNQQGEVDWQNYQAMLTSDFMQGLTLRFYQGPDSNYFDAQLNLETKDLRLLSKAQKRVEREQALEKLKVESKTKGKSTTTYASISCKAIVNFEYVLMINRTTFNIYDLDDDYIAFSRIYYQFIENVRMQLLTYGFAINPMSYTMYSDRGSMSILEYSNEVFDKLKLSFYWALADL